MSTTQMMTMMEVITHDNSAWDEKKVNKSLLFGELSIHKLIFLARKKRSRGAKGERAVRTTHGHISSLPLECHRESVVLLSEICGTI